MILELKGGREMVGKRKRKEPEEEPEETEPEDEEGNGTKVKNWLPREKRRRKEEEERRRKKNLERGLKQNLNIIEYVGFR